MAWRWGSDSTHWRAWCQDLQGGCVPEKATSCISTLPGRSAAVKPLLEQMVGCSGGGELGSALPAAEERADEPAAARHSVPSGLRQRYWVR